MPGTFTQIYIHIVFAVKGRRNLLHENWRCEVFKFMHGIASHKNQKIYIVNGVEDHVHLLVSISPSVAIADVVRDIKNNSSRFINTRKFVQDRFEWQEGYGAFSCGQSQISLLYNYILQQKEHHKKKKFKEEYFQILKKYEVDYDEQYLFDWLDD